MLYSGTFHSFWTSQSNICSAEIFGREFNLEVWHKGTAKLNSSDILSWCHFKNLEDFIAVGQIMNSWYLPSWLIPSFATLPLCIWIFFIASFSLAGQFFTYVHILMSSEKHFISRNTRDYLLLACLELDVTTPFIAHVMMLNPYAQINPLTLIFTVAESN